MHDSRVELVWLVLPVNPLSIDLEQWSKTVFQLIFIEARHVQVCRRSCEPFHVVVNSEALKFIRILVLND
jgi:hypothetical protein